jgi:hypothetical protein
MDEPSVPTNTADPPRYEAPASTISTTNTTRVLTQQLVESPSVSIPESVGTQSSDDQAAVGRLASMSLIASVAASGE